MLKPALCIPVCEPGAPSPPPPVGSLVRLVLHCNSWASSAHLFQARSSAASPNTPPPPQPWPSPPGVLHCLHSPGLEGPARRGGFPTPFHGTNGLHCRAAWEHLGGRECPLAEPPPGSWWATTVQRDQELAELVLNRWRGGRGFSAGTAWPREMPFLCTGPPPRGGWQGQRLIGRRAPLPATPTSCGLSPLDWRPQRGSERSSASFPQSNTKGSCWL